METIIKTLVLTTIAVLSMMPAAAETQTNNAAPEGLACFANLTAPEFPMTALQAHVDGSVWVTVQVGPSGAVDKIDSRVVSAWADGPKLLTAPVEKAIRAAAFKPACYGKSVSAVFRYQLSGEPVAQPKATSNSDGPRIMVIRSQPALAATETSKSAKK